MIIQATKKLSVFLGAELTPPPSDHSHISCWHGNLLLINRRKTLILTHNPSRYTVLIHGLTKRDLPTLPKRIIERISAQLSFDGLTDTQTASLLAQIGSSLTFTKTSSRHVLGSMNDMALLIERSLEHRPFCERAVSSMLNKTPYQIEGVYEYPKDKISELLGVVVSQVDEVIVDEVDEALELDEVLGNDEDE